LKPKQVASTYCSSVSVDHASSWVALKGPWRRASARVGGREGDGLSGCDPDASVKKRRVHDATHRHGSLQPSTPKKFWGAGKDSQRRPVGGDAGTGTRSRGGICRAGGRLGSRHHGCSRIPRLVLAALAFLAVSQVEVNVEYVDFGRVGAYMSVSVDHASSWVALKGTWRQACARVGGREGDGLSGCDPVASVKKRRVHDV